LNNTIEVDLNDDDEVDNMDYDDEDKGLPWKFMELI
jgi:hypothetical protein